MLLRSLRLIMITLFCFGLLLNNAWGEEGGKVDDIIRTEVSDDNVYVDDTEPWKETPGVVPPIPAEDDWQEIPVDRIPNGMNVYLDTRYLHIGKDGVVRYWVSLRTDRGADNTTYEGIMCHEQAVKTYAYMSRRRKNKITEMRNPKWRGFVAGSGDWHYELLDFFCNGAATNSVKEILERIKFPSFIQIDHSSDPDIGPYQY